MKKTLWSVLFVLLAVSLLSAQTWKGKGRVPGIVVDEKGHAIAGVKVKFFCQEWSGGLETTSNKAGKWTAAGIRAGLWQIDFDKPGYAPVHKSMQVNELEKYGEMTVAMRKAAATGITEDMKKSFAAANALYDQKKYAEAVDAYKAFLTSFPQDYFVWRNVGNSYFMLEKYDEAEEAYKNVLAKDPNDVTAYLGVGNCCANRGAMDAAMEWYGKISLDSVSDPNLLLSVGLAYFKASKLEDAVRYLEKAVALDRAGADALYQLGLTYTALQNKEKAVAAFEQYLKIDADSERAGQVKGFLEYLKK